MPRSVPLVVLIFLFASLPLVAGCATQVPASVFPSANLSASVSKIEDHWNFGLGCYWRAYGSVFNSGTGDVHNAVVYVQLIETSSGNIRDAKTIALGTLMKGQARSFEVALDGECDRNYRVEVRPMEEG